MTTKTLEEHKAERLDAAIAELRGVPYLDTAKLRQAIADRDELTERLDDNRRALLALRPSSKEYDAQTAQLAQVTGALAAQLDQARQDAAAEVLALKFRAVQEFDPSAMSARAAELDTKFVRLMVQAVDILTERHHLTEQYNDLVGRVGAYALELRLDPPAQLGTAWRQSWPSWANVVRDHVDKFMRLLPGGVPPAGKEREWLAQR